SLALRQNINRPVGQAVKTPPFHGGNTGSNPVRVTIVSKTGMKEGMLRTRRPGTAVTCPTEKHLSHTCISTSCLVGGLAQLGEHLPYKQGVAGSSPASSTIEKIPFIIQ